MLRCGLWSHIDHKPHHSKPSPEAADVVCAMHAAAPNGRGRAPVDGPMRLGIAIVAAAVLLALPAAAQATVVDLSNSPDMIRVDGASRDDQLGESVANAGDVNGDRIPDTIVGARDADPAGRTDAGAAYVLYGGQRLATVDLRPSDRLGFGSKAQQRPTARARR